MVLFVNTFITDTLIPGKSPKYKMGNRKFLKEYSPLDIFMYSLASLSKAYLWTQIILKISLDENFLSRKSELELFINNEFKGIPLHISWKRNELQKDWQESYELINDDLIWFSCNHDHIFLDSNQDYLNSIVQKMRKESDNIISCCYTHWPEQIAYLSKNKNPSQLQIYDDYATINMINVDSINIISKNLYKKWWFSNKLPEGMTFPRTDWPANMIFNFVDCGTYQKNFIPFKELSRHFDAYYHLNMHQCPALNIPNGFFDKIMRISIGNPERIDDYTWINPMIDKYKAEYETGVDYKWCKEDVPIGWKDRIIRTINYPITERWYEARMKSIVDMLYTDFTTQMVFDQQILNKILNVWMKLYGFEICHE